MKAILRQIRISSKKANLVAALVRNKPVSEATTILKFTTKKSAPILKKVIESAVANAKINQKQDAENLYIEEIVVTEGPTYKRRQMISRGRAHPILKRTAHITVRLGITQPSTESKEPTTTEPTEPKESTESKEEKETKPTKKPTAKPNNQK